MFFKPENINDFFLETFKNLECHPDTKAYINGIFKRYTVAEMDFSTKSITLLYAEARERQDFAGFQNIGDWLFFAASMFPQSLNGASMDYYDTIARSSYYRCYTLLNRQWRLYEELADNYRLFISRTSKLLVIP